MKKDDFEEIGKRLPGYVHYLTYKINRRIYTMHPTAHGVKTIYPQYHILDESKKVVGSLYVKPNNGSNCFDGVFYGEKIFISFDKVRRLKNSQKKMIEPALSKGRDGLTADNLAKIRALPKIGDMK